VLYEGGSTQVEQTIADAVVRGEPIMSPYLARSAYRSAEAETMSPRDLLIRLFVAAESGIREAVGHIARKEVEACNLSCQKSRAIFTELLATLNFEVGGEIALRLKEIYIFLIGEIVECNLRKDGTRLERVLPVISTLREAWEQVPDEHAHVSSLPESARGHTFSASM
jgi:flagellar protein FliS